MAKMKEIKFYHTFPSSGKTIYISGFINQEEYIVNPMGKKYACICQKDIYEKKYLKFKNNRVRCSHCGKNLSVAPKTPKSPMKNKLKQNKNYNRNEKSKEHKTNNKNKSSRLRYSKSSGGVPLKTSRVKRPLYEFEKNVDNKKNQNQKTMIKNKDNKMEYCNGIKNQNIDIRKNNFYVKNNEDNGGGKIRISSIEYIPPCPKCGKEMFKNDNIFLCKDTPNCNGTRRLTFSKIKQTKKDADKEFEKSFWG